VESDRRDDLDNSLWRYTALSPKFFCVDAKAVFPLGIFALHWSWITLTVALVSTLGLLILQRKHIPFGAFLRYLRVLLVGRFRPATDTHKFRIRSRF
jgi:hypothetical protein